jgi:hypothetical protein
LKPLREAGYEVVQHSYRSTSPGFVADIGVHDTLVARALLQQDVLGKEKWKVQTGEKETWGNKGTSDHSSRYRGTFTATMPFPGSADLVWKITAQDVPFVIDPSQSSAGRAVYGTPSGTLTQVSYTVPGAIGCSGDPASFTDTLTILPGDGSLAVKTLAGGQVEYVGSASISQSPELVDHPFQRCCSYTNPSCEPDVLKKGGQEHEWWLTGNSPQTGPAEGPLTGTFSQSMGARYEWTLVRDDQ